MKSTNENIIITPSKKKSEKKVNVVFKNELTIFSIEDIKGKLNHVIKDYQKIDIEIKEVVNLDLSFIQLLYSIKSTAEKLKKKITLEVNLSDDLSTLLHNSDLSKVVNN